MRSSSRASEGSRAPVRNQYLFVSAGSHSSSPRLFSYITLSSLETTVAVQKKLWGVLMRVTVAAAVSCLLLTSLAAAQYAAASIRKDMHIPPQSLDSALQTFAQDRDLQLVYA